MRDYGNAIHKGLEIFANDYKKALPPDADKRLIGCFETAMLEAGYPDYDIAKEGARLEKIAVQIVEWMR